MMLEFVSFRLRFRCRDHQANLLGVRVRRARRFIDCNWRFVTGESPLLPSGRIDPTTCRITRDDIAIAGRPTHAVFAAPSAGTGELHAGTDPVPKESEFVAIEPIILASRLHETITAPMTIGNVRPSRAEAQARSFECSRAVCRDGTAERAGAGRLDGVIGAVEPV